MMTPGTILAAADALAFDINQVLDRIPGTYYPLLFWGAITLLALLILRIILRGLSRRVRRLRGPTINPRLAKYNVDHAQLDRERRKLAVQIIATSTGTRLAGFRIVRQVEAVFVDGLRTPEDALIALKAEAAERGANALVNVKTERTAAGRCAASGDAVVAAPISARPGQQPPPPKSRPPAPDSPDA